MGRLTFGPASFTSSLLSDRRRQHPVVMQPFQGRRRARGGSRRWLGARRRHFPRALLPDVCGHRDRVHRRPSEERPDRVPPPRGHGRGRRGPGAGPGLVLELRDAPPRQLGLPAHREGREGLGAGDVQVRGGRRHVRGPGLAAGDAVRRRGARHAEQGPEGAEAAGGVVVDGAAAQQRGQHPADARGRLGDPRGGFGRRLRRQRRRGAVGHLQDAGAADADGGRGWDATRYGEVGRIICGQKNSFSRLLCH